MLKHFCTNANLNYKTTTSTKGSRWFSFAPIEKEQSGHLFNMWQLPWVQGGFADCPVMMNRTPRYLRASDGHMLIHCPTLKTINPQLNPSSTEKPINLHCNPLLSLKFPPDQQKNASEGLLVGEHGGSGLASLLSLFKTGKI